MSVAAEPRWCKDDRHGHGHGHGYGHGHGLAHDYGYTPGVFNFQELADEYDGKASGHRHQEGQHAVHLEEVSWVAIEREP